MQRDKALEMALGQIEKQYGKGAVMRMDDQAKIKIACIPTGALSLDLALGIGGLPRGRVVEVYGPEGSGKTTVALHAIAEAQKAGGIAAFIDAEHALDPSYAAALGVDIEALLVSQPDNGEQALEIADMLIRSNAIDILVVDSVAALTPKAEIEGEMGDSHVGLQARLMSQALRKLAGTLNRSRTCAVFVNQIREKIGVMFGCFSYGTKVTLADGTQEEIGKIVTQRMDVEVLSYDPDLGRIVSRKVVNWFDNGPTTEFLNVVVARGGRNGDARFSCTANHQIRTPAGWREAQELSVGDRVLQAVPYHLSDFQWDVVLGGLMGAAALSPTRSGFGARLRWGHGEQQVAYGDWKASLFANVGVRRSTNATGAVFHDVEPLPELEELCDAVCIAGKKVVSHDYLKRLTPLSLAVWYMDAAALAGSSAYGQRDRVDICVEAMEATSRERLADWLRDEWGVGSRLTERGGKAILQFRREDIEALQALIAPYVHPSMDDTLLPRFRGQFNVEPVFTEKHNELVPMPVVSITPTSRPADGGETSRYDLEVEGTHNYFVDGVMVHNSPETQPGGRALKFYSSVRLDVRRIESLKDGTDFVGNRVRVKVVKNKCVAAGTRVFDPTTGITHAIEDIVDRGEGSAVWAADKRGVLHVGAIGARLDQGQQEVIGLVLADGTELRVTPDHLVLTEEGWRPAGELPPGARVARPRRAGGFGQHEPLHDDAVPGTRLHPAFFSLEASAQVVANLLYGIWERDGWVSDERTGGLRCGFLTTSEQLAWQLHWLLLRWGISTSVMARHPRPRRSLATGGGVEAEAPCWQVRTRGIEDVRRFAAALPMAGPKGKKLIGELARSQSRTHHGGPTANLPASQTAPILAYLRHRGVSATRVASLIGVSATRAQGGMRSVLGQGRLRRDRIETLAEALDSTFLRDVVAEELYYDRIVSITPARWERTFDLEVDELHNFVADDVVVHNCAPPFRQAEFDIMFGHGISREGSVLDVGVEHGIVKKAGAWYTYDGEQLGQGRENARSFLKEHDEVCAEIYKKVTEALGLVPTDVTGTDGDGEDVLAPGPVDR